MKNIIHNLGDGPSRSKASNFKQHNGKYACIKCLHPTVYTKKTIYPDPKREVRLRTNEMYIKHVNKAIEIGEPYKGVKGYSYMSSWMSMPRCITLEYMHLTLLGSFRSTFNNFYSKSKKIKTYCLSKLTRFIFYFKLLI